MAGCDSVLPRQVKTVPFHVIVVDRSACVAEFAAHVHEEAIEHEYVTNLRTVKPAAKPPPDKT